MTNNQEILFRGFHQCEDGGTTIYVEGEAVKGRWIFWNVFGELIKLATGEYLWGHISDYHIISSTVCQYTGLNDKNNEKIFTNDRLDLTDWAKRDRTVEVLGFHNGVCWFGGDGFSDEYLFNSSNRLVIGTIFDKPKEATT